MDPVLSLEDHWEYQDSKEIGDGVIFKILCERWKYLPEDECIERTVIDSQDWVSIIAHTPENKIVLVREFRFGSRKVKWQFPSGLVDAGENPITAAIREMGEETGWACPKDVRQIGSFNPNPAFMNNAMHVFAMTFDSERETPSPGKFEILEYEEFDESEIDHLIRDKEIDSGIMISAWYLYQQWYSYQQESKNK